MKNIKNKMSININITKILNNKMKTNKNININKNKTILINNKVRIIVNIVETISIIKK